VTTQSPLHPLITNQRVGIDNTSFKAKQFFFSNNDKYFGVIGATELIAFDSRTGREVYRRSFPKGDWRPLMPQLGPGVDGPGQRPSTSVTRQPAKKVTICPHAEYDHSAGPSRCPKSVIRRDNDGSSYNEEENTTFNEESAGSASALNDIHVTHASNHE